MSISLSLIWLGVAVLLAILEASSPMLVCIWFCAGAVITFIASFFIDSLLIQIAIFTVASLVMLIALRPLMVKRTRTESGKEVPMNSDAYVGRIATITQEATKTSSGRAALGDTSWIAVSERGDRLPIGTQVRVVRVDGARLFVVPLTSQESQEE